ncbi:DNA recombination protein RmuC [Endozoicomonas ascidiicola]|uniref:DNA recombination protein RmuC n=1 Tax=Endozoicomonas ascidiicola TaxID=1698521 RepID=UPI0008370834|nr:DNA recombination protein RmuC [Endozoicomonas ascidiicola]
MTFTALVAVAASSLLSFAVAWVVCRQSQQSEHTHMHRDNESLQVQVSQLSDQNISLQVTLDENQSKRLRETTKLNEQVNQHQLKAGRLEAILISERKREAEKSRDLQERSKELSQERAERNQAEQRVRELETRLEEQQSQNQKALMQLQENKETLKQEFKHLAHEIFEARGKVFSDQHQQQLSALLTPFKEQLGDFRNKVEAAHKEDSAGRAALKQQLETMHQLNRQMTDEAQNLAKALKGDKKLQGNWGEMQVETILESSGLVKGQEYEREPNFKDDDGQNKRPDFIVRLPEGKHLIIDSKVSLVDYMAYVNAENDKDRDAAMARHIQSIRNHINSLNQKDYPSLPEIKTPDFVFMFMPIEPAFISAFQYDQQLFNEAFEKRIVVVTPTTLLATLRTVANLWTIERQNANARKLADKGRQVYDKLRIFVEKMEKLDSQLGNARTTYDEAMSTLKHGRGNLIAQADQFLALGVRVKKELPAKTLETADLGTGEIDALLKMEAEAEQPATSPVEAAAPDLHEDKVEPTPGADMTEVEVVEAEAVEKSLDEPAVEVESELSTGTSEPEPVAVEQDPQEASEALHPESEPEETTEELPDFAEIETRLEMLNTELPALEDELARLEQEYPEATSTFSEENYRSEDGNT